MQKLTRSQILGLRQGLPQSQTGFTLIEMLVIVIIIGILSAIVAPSWLAFTNRQRVNAVNDAVLRALQEGQSTAKLKKLSYSVSFRSPSGARPEFAIHPTNDPNNNDPTTNQINPNSLSSNFWKVLGENQNIKPSQVLICANVDVFPNRNKLVTTTSCDLTQPRTITFDYQGNLPEDSDIGSNGLAIVTANPQFDNTTTPVISTKRCVKVKTLLGSIQTQQANQCP